MYMYTAMLAYWDNTVSMQCGVCYQFTPDSFESPLDSSSFGLGLPSSSEGWLSASGYET